MIRGARSISGWKQIINGLTSVQIAGTVLEDLIGYNKKSVHREDDVQNLSNLIAALRGFDSMSAK